MQVTHCTIRNNMQILVKSFLYDPPSVYKIVTDIEIHYWKLKKSQIHGQGMCFPDMQIHTLKECNNTRGDKLIFKTDNSSGIYSWYKQELNCSPLS